MLEFELRTNYGHSCLLEAIFSFEKYGVPEGLGPERYVKTYHKTKLAVKESTALLCFIGRLINQCLLGLPQI